MSIVTMLTRNSPTLAGVSFDATLETTFKASIDITGYPLASGAEAADHSIFNPLEFTMTILASNNPLRPQVTDFIGGAISNYVDLPTIAGLSSGFLSGRADTHAAVVLTDLIGKMVDRQPISVYGGDIQLDSMMITGIDRTRTTENENGLECIVTLQELPTLDLIHGGGMNVVNTAKDDPAHTSAGKKIHKGIAKVNEAADQFVEDLAFHVGEVFNV
jgi:hypothetical protein